MPPRVLGFALPSGPAPSFYCLRCAHADANGSYTADPGAAGGIDLDSDAITELAMECPNLAGVKLTCVPSSASLYQRLNDLPFSSRVAPHVPCRCGNVGKLTRICATVSDPSFDSAHPRLNPDAPFLVLGGFVDFVLPTTFVNADGAITGLGNVAPVSKRPSLCSVPSADAHLTSPRAHSTRSTSCSRSPRPVARTPPSCRRRSACRASPPARTSRLLRPASLARRRFLRSCTATAATRVGRCLPSRLRRWQRSGNTLTPRRSYGLSAS